MPAIEPDAKTLKKRLELCLEALRLRKKINATTIRIEAIKAELKIFAKDLGRGFRETDVKLGHVSVSPEKPERFDGDFPVVDVRKWQSLSDSDRKKHLESGLVVIESQWSKPYHGRVDIELY